MKKSNKYITNNNITNPMQENTSDPIATKTVSRVPQEKPKKSLNKKPEDKPEKKSLFSGLFGKKKSKPTREGITTNVELVPQVQSTSIPQEPQDTVNKQQLPKPEIKPVPEKVATQIKKNVTRLKMEQIIWLYSSPEIWGGIQKTFQEFTGVLCLGTSDLYALQQEYSKCGYTVSTIYIFISSDSEVHTIKEFIESLGIDNLIPEALSIRLVLDQHININELRAIPNISRFVKTLTVKFNSLTEITLQKIISDTVSKQPLYPSDETTYKEPDKSRFVSSTKNLYNNYDINEITKAVEKARNNTDLTTTINSMTNKIMTTNSSLTALDIIKSAPALKILTSVEQELAQKIDKVKYNPLMREEVEDLIQTKLLITSLSTKEVKKLINQIVDNASESAKTYQSEIEGIDTSILDDIEDIKADAQELLETRNNLKKKIVDAFERYKKQTSVIVSLLEVEKTQYALVDRELCNTLGDNRLSFGDETESAITVTINKIRGFEDQVSETQLKIRGELEKAFNNANTLLHSQQALIELDDNLLNIFQETIEEQNRIIKTRTTSVLGSYGDTRFSERSSILYIESNTDARTILSNIADSGDMFIIINPKEDELPLFRVEEDFEIYNNNFTGYDLDEIKHSSNIVVLNLTYLEDNDVLFSQLDYLAPYFNHMFIITKNSSGTFTPMEDRLYRNCKKIIYWFRPLQQYMMTLNKVKTNFSTYNNLILQKVLFDGWDSEWDLDYRNSLRAIANLSPDDGEILITSISQFLTDGSDTVLKESIRQRLRTIKKLL